VVQLDNYKEIPMFTELCKELGIDRINFQKMWNWGTWDQDVFNKKNVFDKSHPNYLDLKEIFKKANRPMPR
jgi:MoaA/NifB/PqqE/SkfB family radical SAM enzyme